MTNISTCLSTHTLNASFKQCFTQAVTVNLFFGKFCQLYEVFLGFDTPPGGREGWDVTNRKFYLGKQLNL